MRKKKERKALSPIIRDDISRIEASRHRIISIEQKEALYEADSLKPVMG